MTQRVPLAVLLLLLAGGFRGAQERLEAVCQRHIRRWALGDGRWHSTMHDLEIDGNRVAMQKLFILLFRLDINLSAGIIMLAQYILHITW